MYLPDKIKKTLTEDDLKVIKHLSAIDNLFKKGNTSIRLFAGPTAYIYVTTVKDGQEYELCSFGNIPHDGGDCDWGFGYGCIASQDDYMDTLPDDDED